MPKAIHRVLATLFLCLAPILFSCKPTCATTSDCDQGDVCDDGVCTEICRSNGDCPSGQACMNRVCQAEPMHVDPPDGPAIRPTSITVFEATIDPQTGRFAVVGAGDVDVVIHANDGTPISTIKTAWDGYAGFI